MQSLFTPLIKEGLTTLTLRYDYRSGQSTLLAAREWDEDLDFAQYNRDFCIRSLLTKGYKTLNDGEVRALYEKYGLTAYLNQVLGLLAKGKHFGIDCFYCAQRDIRFMGNIHSLGLGINNKYQAIAAGGIRRHGLEDAELEVIIDGLNLARGMSFKNVAAEIPFGGSKTTVHMQPLDLEDTYALGFLAYAIDRIRTMTGPDMNFPTEMSDIINERFSLQFTNGPGGPMGESGTPTAYGTFLALKEAVRFKTGDPSLAGMTAAVQGLGAVGWHLAELLLGEGVKLTVSDINRETVDKLVQKHPGQAITVARPEEIMALEADIFCPCAMGGIFHKQNIDALRFGIIFGPANNQLKASSQEEEIELANRLMERGILFQEAWWHNTAGVMAGAEEYIHGKDASLERLNQKIAHTVPRKTRENLNKAHELGLSPTECMYRTCENIIYKR